MHNKLFVVFVLLNPVTVDQWLKTGSLKGTLEKCEQNGDEKCSDTTVSDMCEGELVNNL
jgi:hypothetical protein